MSILSVLRHLNYRPWFAMAEFVDNSLQSYLDYHDALRRIEGVANILKVSIEIDCTDEGQIIIRDNAAGIHEADYSRAFRAAEVPPDRRGLCEFGMGMKSAACWFANKWKVRTSALGEAVERTVSFNIDTIVNDKIEELTVDLQPIQPNTHFTEIELFGLHKPPQGRTIAKIKDHLASIYRMFIRKGTLELCFNQDILSYPEPKILTAPFFKKPNAQPQLWRKEIEFDFGLGLRAHGFAALREIGSTTSAGFALFRRERLVQGSSDEGYRPEVIFGKSNSFIYQRLFGELQLEGFEISHTKDGFRWDENEEVFLEFLKEKLNAEPLPMLDQAEGHRSRPKPGELLRGAEIATQHTADVIKRDVPPVLAKQIEEKPEDKTLPQTLPPVAVTTSFREITVELHGCSWKIHLELTNDPAIGEWVSISDKPHGLSTATNGAARCVSVRLSLAHPFMERFSGTDPTQIEPLLRVAAAICLAEVAARDSGVKHAGTIRKNVNDLLRNAFSKP